jgi:flagellar basal body-associated protein FliL
MTNTQGALISIAAIAVIVSVILAVVGLVSWLLHRASQRTPYCRRELEATYASFRRFLMTVQAVVVKRLQE